MVPSSGAYLRVLKQKIKTRPNFNVKAFSGDDNIDVSQLMSGIELSKYCNVNKNLV